MDETQDTRIKSLLDALLKRMEFEVDHVPPQVLPDIARTIVVLYSFKTGINDASQKAMAEIELIKNINKQIKFNGNGDGQNGNITTGK